MATGNYEGSLDDRDLWIFEGWMNLVELSSPGEALPAYLMALKTIYQIPLLCIRSLSQN